MNKNDTKKHLLDTGMKLVIENGYNHTGLNEILEAAQVPKGSFYYYFDSKEDFGLQLIDSYDQKFLTVLREILLDENYDPLTRLRHYFQYNIDYLTNLQCRQGCLIGNLGQEMSDQNETFRNRLKQSMDARAQMLINCIQKAQAVGQISADLNPEKIGEYLNNNWQGALLMMKIAKSTEPLETFLHGTFEVVLKK